MANGGIYEFLRGLLRQIERRADVLRSRLSAIPDDPDLRDHLLPAYQAAETIRRRASSVLSDPSLGTPSLLGNHLRTAQGLERSAALIESYFLPFLERYDDHDRRLTRLCRRLTSELRLPIDTPLVFASSQNYYWALPEFNIICAPATEEASILRWPDLCHELGHILLEGHRAEILGDFLRLLADYVEVEKRRVRQLQRPPGYVALYDRLLAQWIDAWLPEFVGDMVATYLVGPAFGWQHIRLCASEGKDVYHPALDETASHPADEARLRGLLAVLQIFADPSGPAQTALMAQYVTAGGQKLSADYSVCYPDSLLSSLALRVVDGCRGLGLRAYVDAGNPDHDVGALIAAAWQRFLADEPAYSAWEQAHLSALWRILK